MLYIYEDVTVLTLQSHSKVVCGTLIMHLKQPDVIYTFYHPPDASNYDGKFDEYLTKIKEVLTNLEQCLNILLMGDFTFPIIRCPKDAITSRLVQREPN